MRPTTAYCLELLMRRRLRAALIKAVCVIALLSALIVGWGRIG
jgi:hypothetical protein